MAAADGFHSVRIRQIAFNVLADATVEGLGRFPAQLPLQLARIDGVTAVVAGVALHEGDLGRVARAARLRVQFVWHRVDGPHSVQVGFFPAADIVGPAQMAGFQQVADGVVMVFHVQRVAHLLAIAVNRQRFAREYIVHHQRDQLLRAVVRAVVVVGAQHRQAVSTMLGARKLARISWSDAGLDSECGPLDS